jgi:hypothetical protein
MRTHARLNVGWCTRVVIPAAAERERERERECVCVRECEAKRSEAVRVGPAWLQQHGCEFVMGVILGARGSRHTKAKWGERAILFRFLTEAG